MKPGKVTFEGDNQAVMNYMAFASTSDIFFI
jgi:hypothetical protein